jgi:hypothetical protein
MLAESSANEPRPVFGVAGVVGGPRGLAFAADGRSLFVSVDSPQTPGSVSAVLRVPIDGSAVQDTGIRFKNGSVVQQISAHPDGRQLALSMSAQGRETWVLPKFAQAVLKGQPAK